MAKGLHVSYTKSMTTGRPPLGVFQGWGDYKGSFLLCHVGDLSVHGRSDLL